LNAVLCPIVAVKTITHTRMPKGVGLHRFGNFSTWQQTSRIHD
jgi:hypothetical protein